MAEVTLIDFSYLNRLALLTFTEVGPSFQNQDSRLGPVIEKAKSFLSCNILIISVTSVVLISEGQPCPTSSGMNWYINVGQGRAICPCLSTFCSAFTL